MIDRRQVLKSIAGSVGVVGGFTAIGAADSSEDPQPINGELPNKHAPEDWVSPLPKRFFDETTVQAGKFVTMGSGWRGDNLKELLNKTRHIYTFEDQTFVLDSYEEWEQREGDLVYFTHTDPPYPNGSNISCSLDVIVTDPLDGDEKDYQPGGRFKPWFFPTSRTYDVVQRSHSF